jgi:hypothetical protein
MWRPGLVGAVCGWTVVILLVLIAFSEPLFEFAVRQGACGVSTEKRICSGYLGFLIGPGVLPVMYMSALVAPFSGIDDTFFATVSPLAYLMSLLALNFWVWQVRRALG